VARGGSWAARLSLRARRTPVQRWRQLKPPVRSSVARLSSASGEAQRPRAEPAQLEPIGVVRQRPRAVRQPGGRREGGAGEGAGPDRNPLKRRRARRKPNQADSGCCSSKARQDPGRRARVRAEELPSPGQVPAPERLRAQERVHGDHDREHDSEREVPAERVVATRRQVEPGRPGQSGERGNSSSPEPPSRTLPHAASPAVHRHRARPDPAVRPPVRYGRCAAGRLCGWRSTPLAIRGWQRCAEARAVRRPRSRAARSSPFAGLAHAALTGAPPVGVLGGCSARSTARAARDRRRVCASARAREAAAAVLPAYTEANPECWGPRDTETIVDKMEVMTGGDWRFIHRNCGRSVPRHLSGGDAPERIAQTFEWEGMPGERRHRGARGPRRPRDGMLEAGMEAGLQEWYDRLDEVLERLGNPCRGCPRLRGRRPDQLTAGRARVRPRRAARARVGSG
jgi:hypothetical protein